MEPSTRDSFEDLKNMARRAAAFMDELDAMGMGRLAQSEPIAGETLEARRGPRFVRIGEAVFNVETIRSVWVGKLRDDDGEASQNIWIEFTDGTGESGTLPLLAPDPRDELVGRRGGE